MLSKACLISSFMLHITSLCRLPLLWSNIFHKCSHDMLSEDSKVANKTTKGKAPRELYSKKALGIFVCFPVFFPSVVLFTICFRLSFVCWGENLLERLGMIDWLKATCPEKVRRCVSNGCHHQSINVSPLITHPAVEYTFAPMDKNSINV